MNRKSKLQATRIRSASKWRLAWRNRDYYVLLIPGLLFLLLFKYTPLYGVLIAFQDFNIFEGIRGSEWVGLEQFHKLIQSDEFGRVFMNTLLISVYKIVLLFPVPIFIALVLNEVRLMFFKRTIQTIIYLPHFLSWVIISGLFVTILSTSGGLVNTIIQWFGGEPVSFLSAMIISAVWLSLRPAGRNQGGTRSSSLPLLPESIRSNTRRLPLTGRGESAECCISHCRVFCRLWC